MKYAIENWGGRRFIMVMGCAIVSTVLVWNGKITDVVFRDIIGFTVAAYITGNVAQKIKTNIDKVEEE